MKKIFFFTIFFTIYSITIAQNRAVTRGAEPGELYLTSFWYGIYAPPGSPYYDTVRTAIYHITENGKKLTIQYDVNYFEDNYTEPGSVMQPQHILADATLGVLYARRTYEKSDYYPYTQLWVSFDYGKNWQFREENIGQHVYVSTNVQGVIYRGSGLQGMFKSINYGQDFFILEDVTKLGTEAGLIDCEFFSLSGRGFYHTFDCFANYINITIDEEYASSALTGFFPDVYRGGKEGEVYIHSWFPGYEYRASFSADTGHTFQHVYIESNAYNSSNMFGARQLLFMSDREPGVFYILHLKDVKDTNPGGWHLELCIEYYRDYGATLVATYCHDVNKNYSIENCEAVIDLSAEIMNENSILLSWTEPEDDLEIEGYSVFRNEQLIMNNEQLIINNFYLDENLPVGEYEYYVVTHYTNGCISDTSNHVVEMIGVGVKEVNELDGVSVFPNPTTGEVRIENGELRIENVEVIDVYGRKLLSHHHIVSSSHHLINISHLQAGIYFVKITTEKGITTKKIVKY